MKGLRVLLAEDKSAAAERLTVQLKRLGHTVVWLARDGREALVCASRLEPELIFLGTHLPVLDGIETARAILAQRPVPLILLTSYAAANFVQRAREAGVMTYLVTPVESGRLARAIEEARARFRELDLIREEASDLNQALEIRNRVEQAKRVLMRRRKLCEADAFRQLQQQSQRTRIRLGETALAIVRADQLLLSRGLSLTRTLPSLLAAIQRGLQGPPAAHSAPLPRASSEPGGRPAWPPSPVPSGLEK
ncbi:MAG TPA: response regulator [Vicinamibacteria bacterium]|nr:response regulator [Vicinamibacteria bacterium]